jgi:hypothetical protein
LNIGLKRHVVGVAGIVAVGKIVFFVVIGTTGKEQKSQKKGCYFHVSNHDLHYSIKKDGYLVIEALSSD